jgi:chemosensory pili system protein ChpA (sensor histidine kinase/response regulator)
VELDAAYQAGRFDYNGDGVAFFWAGALLQTSRASEEARGRTSAVAIFRSAGQRVAMHVDEVLGNQEVVVKNLGPQLARIPGLAGMSVLASGAVVLIYNPVAMVATHGEQARAYVEAGAASETATLQGVTGTGLPMTVNQLPLVLVVDDSITVRRVTQRLLKREGFRVALASDGLHALELLQVEKPSVVLTDIEMPRMDGFDLVRNIRGDARLQDLPIIMITSRIAEKHREYARALNVDHYLGKPYPEDELIALVRGYCAVELSV